GPARLSAEHDEVAPEVVDGEHLAGPYLVAAGHREPAVGDREREAAHQRAPPPAAPMSASHGRALSRASRQRSSSPPCWPRSAGVGPMRSTRGARAAASK